MEELEEYVVILKDPYTLIRTSVIVLAEDANDAYGKAQEDHFDYDVVSVTLRKAIF